MRPHGCLWAAAAGVYLSTLVRHAGDATWEGLRSPFKSEEVKPLADVSKALVCIANQTEARVEIVVGVNVPDEYWGTRATNQGGDLEEVARKQKAGTTRRKKEPRQEACEGTPRARARPKSTKTRLQSPQERPHVHEGGTQDPKSGTAACGRTSAAEAVSDRGRDLCRSVMPGQPHINPAPYQ